MKCSNYDEETFLTHLLQSPACAAFSFLSKTSLAFWIRIGRTRRTPVPDTDEAFCWRIMSEHVTGHDVSTT